MRPQEMADTIRDRRKACTKAPPILTSSQAALIILTDARKAGVPLPRTVEQLHLDDQSEAQLVFYVRNLTDLAAWSAWIEAPISTSPYVMASGRVHSSVEGRLFDHNVRAVCLFVPSSEVPA
jgi:hypothetical protein